MTTKFKKYALSTIPALIFMATQSINFANADPLTGTPATYTLDAHFDQGTMINVIHDPSDQLQLDDTVTPFNFIWVAASARGTIVKIDTTTGEILGEYLSAPDNRGRNPSRTTVDANGNVWAGNRDEAFGGQGSVVHIGLIENGQCEDRNTNGVIDTSTGLGDIKTWDNALGADDNGGTSTAADECIINYVRTSGTNVRTVAINGNNDVWIGGLGNRAHELYDGDTGAPVAGTKFTAACGGYGGLLDGNGVLWSSSSPGAGGVLRYDPADAVANPIGKCININTQTYGMGIDTNGYIWVSNYSSNSVVKIAPDGMTFSGPFPSGGASNDRGVAITPADNNVWIANSGGSDVSRLDNSGGILAVIPVGVTPTGVAVDGDGFVWVTNLSSNTASRINPATNLVETTVDLGAGAGPYNYSDMTGSTVIAPPTEGTWEVIHDTELDAVEWGFVSWNADLPGDSSIVVSVASSNDGITFGLPEVATNGGDLSIDDGRWLKVIVNFIRSTNTDADSNGIMDSPILYDLTINALKPFMHGKIQGHGKIKHDGLETEHDFKFYCDINRNPNWLNVKWREDDHHHMNHEDDHGMNNNSHHHTNVFQLTSISQATCLDDPTFDPYPPHAGFDYIKGSGMGRVNGKSGYSVNWLLTDAGEPGYDDYVNITITDSNGDVVLSFSGNLDKGNHNAVNLGYRTNGNGHDSDDDDDDDDHQHRNNDHD